MENLKEVKNNTNYLVSETGEIYKKNKNGYKLIKKYKLKNGYLSCSINGVNKLVHRVIYEAFNENEHIQIIDHINGIRDDNNIKNLRNTDHIENSFNKVYKCHNKNKLQNSNIYLDNNKYRVKICKHNKIYNKRFLTLDEAINYKMEVIEEIEGVIKEYRENLTT